MQNTNAQTHVQIELVNNYTIPITAAINISVVGISAEAMEYGSFSIGDFAAIPEQESISQEIKMPYFTATFVTQKIIEELEKGMIHIHVFYRADGEFKNIYKSFPVVIDEFNNLILQDIIKLIL